MTRGIILLFVFASLSLYCRRSNPDSNEGNAKKPAFTALEDPKWQIPPRQRYEELFADVQKARIFPDGKTFVDCIPLSLTDTILAHYRREKEAPGFDLTAFVKANFALPTVPASDFKSNRQAPVADHIHSLWPLLTRQPDQHDPGTLIPLRHPYIVPGGRFREIYYWDSYFTMLGLQQANRVDMIRNMIDNFAFLIDTIGFIPNGNRTYFLTRSQPPFFSLMVGVLAEMQGDSIWTHYLPQLEKEYAFWMDGEKELGQGNPAVRHVVRLPDGSILNRFWDKGDYPREEMFADDIETAKRNKRPANITYRNLRSAAESGWDFSSRWLSNPQDLATIHTVDIIPVDLNALLYNLEMVISRAYTLKEDRSRAAQYLTKANRRKQALQRYCWDPSQGFFVDYDFVAQNPTGVLSLAGVYPLFFQLADAGQANAVAQILRTRFLQPGGLTSTLVANSQQWDAPNGWAPLQWMAVNGLRQYGQDDLARTISQRWIALNEQVFRNTGKMMEKYNVYDLSLESGGGEYPVQDGFGWSNGVFLRLLHDYPPNQ